MLAEAGAVLWFESIANDVAVAHHTVRIGALAGSQRQSDLRRRIRRQADLGERTADKCPADPVLGFEKPCDLSDEPTHGIGKIEQCRGAVWGDDDIRRGRRML